MHTCIYIIPHGYQDEQGDHLGFVETSARQVMGRECLVFGVYPNSPNSSNSSDHLVGYYLGFAVGSGPA